MALPASPLVVATAGAAGAAYASSTTATSLIPSGAIGTIPAGALAIGSVVRITAFGQMSVTTSATTLTFDVRFTGASTVVVGNLGAITMLTTGFTNVAWWLDVMLTCRSVGSGTTATMMPGGRFSSTAAVAGGGGLPLPSPSPAVGTGFDSTVAQQVNLFGTWSLNNASNSITVMQYLFEFKGP